MIIIWIIYFVVLMVIISGNWKMLEKGGQPGISMFIPIYNFYILSKLAGYEDYIWLLYFVPFVNFFFAINVYYRISIAFGKSGGFTALILFLPFIAFPILGHGDARYNKKHLRMLNAYK